MSSTQSQKIPLFGQRLFGEANFYFGDADPSQILLSMISSFWAISNPPASKVVFTSRWTDPTTKTIRPLQISFLRAPLGHRALNIAAATKFRADGAVNMHIWTLVGAIDTATQVNLDDAIQLHQNMVEECRRIIRTYGTTADKKFMLGPFTPRDEIEDSPQRLRTHGFCPYAFFRSD